MSFIPREILKLADRINMSGTTAARPDACKSNVGCLYLATDDDGGTLFRSDGSSWVQVAKGVSEAASTSFEDITSGTNLSAAMLVGTGSSLGPSGTGIVQANDLTAKSVDVGDLKDGTDGELITWDAAGEAATVAAGTSGQVLTSNGAGAAPTFQAASGGTNALLDGSTHTDTVAQTVSRGSLVYGNSTPAWDELAVGTAREVLTSDGTDVAWKATAGMQVGGISNGVAVTSSGLTSAFTNAPTVLVNLGGFGTYRVEAGNSLILPAGWLTQFDATNLRHRFTVEAYRNSGTGSVEFELYDLTNSLQIATVTGITAASRTFYSSTSFSNIPAGDATIVLRARWQTSASEFGLFGYAWHVESA